MEGVNKKMKYFKNNLAPNSCYRNSTVENEKLLFPNPEKRSDFDKEIREIVNGVCPQCGSEEVFIVRKSNRQGWCATAICHKCGYQKNLLSFDQHVDTETTLLKVTINGKPTNLVVDEFNINEETLDLSAHTRPLTIHDLKMKIIHDDTSHKKRICNQLKKIITNGFNGRESKRPDIQDITFSRGYISLIVEQKTCNQIDYPELLAKTLHINEASITVLNHIPTEDAKINGWFDGTYVIVINCHNIPSYLDPNK